MKVRTSITLSEELLSAIDRLHPNRSEFIERLVRRELAEQRRREREARDAMLYTKHNQELNQQALESLEDQVEP